MFPDHFSRLDIISCKMFALEAADSLPRGPYLVEAIHVELPDEGAVAVVSKVLR